MNSRVDQSSLRFNQACIVALVAIALVTGAIWLAALAYGPRPYAQWVLIEEKAEGGDMLAIRARQDPHFLDGYSRVCEGAGLALYERLTAQGSRLTPASLSPKQ